MTSSAQVPRKSTGPVPWGLSKTLLASLTRTLLFTLFPDRLDPRDWMKATPVRNEDFSRAIVRRDDLQCHEFWFDFINDTGDSGRATESIGYYLQGALFADDPHGQVDANPKNLVNSRVYVELPAASARLPSGSFLLMGGDLAYAIADDPTIRERLVDPFNAAFHRRNAQPGELPYLFAVPGNHDWYDHLEGFNRLIRVPPGSAAPPPKISLHGFRRAQWASYAAIELPFDWSLLVVDDRNECDVDYRQRQLFGEFLDEDNGRRRRRLILATSRPPIVFGYKKEWAQRLLDQLTAKDSAQKPPSFEPPANEARVYLSGDSHHYARHNVEPGERPAASDRAVAVVCGLGGASLHPPRKNGTHPAEPTFPSVEEAKTEILKRLLSPRHMIVTSRFGGFGAILGFFVGVGLGAFEGEPAGLLRRLGLFWFAPYPPPGPNAAPDPSHLAWPRTLAALVVFVVALGLMFGVILRKRKKNEGDVNESHARSMSKVTRTLRMAMVVGLVGWIALAVSRTFDGPPVPISVVDVVVYAVVLLLSVGLGAVVYYVSDKTEVQKFAQSALIVIVGSSFGVAMVAGLGALVGWGLGEVASLQVVMDALKGTSEPGVVGFALYTLIAAGAGLLGAAIGFVIVPVFFGWLIAGLYLLGHHQTFAGSVALIDRYRTFIRFRLRKYASPPRTELTGFVIGVRDASDVPRSDDGPVAEAPASLVDVFVVELADDPNEVRVALP